MVRWWGIACSQVMLLNGVVWSVKSRGPKTDTWGYPNLRSALEDKQSPSLIPWHLPVKYDSNQLSAFPVTPNQSLSLLKRMVWSMVSKWQNVAPHRQWHNLDSVEPSWYQEGSTHVSVSQRGRKSEWQRSTDQSNFYSANMPGIPRLSGATADRIRDLYPRLVGQLLSEPMSVLRVPQRNSPVTFGRYCLRVQIKHVADSPIITHRDKLSASTGPRVFR